MNYKYNPIEDCYATKKKIYIFRKEIENKLNKVKNYVFLIMVVEMQTIFGNLYITSNINTLVLIFINIRLIMPKKLLITKIYFFDKITQNKV